MNAEHNSSLTDKACGSTLKTGFGSTDSGRRSNLRVFRIAGCQVGRRSMYSSDSAIWTSAIGPSQSLPYQVAPSR
jgi:hypothetical protein